MAQAESGVFSQAIASAKLAHQLALGADNEELVADIAARIELYRSGKPYRRPRPVNE